VASQPWWLINATTGTPPQWVVTQFATKPVPANPAFTVTGPYASEAAAKAAAPAGAKISVQAWNSVGASIKADLGAAAQGAAAGATGNPSLDIGNPLSGLLSIGAFFNGLKSALTSANLWIRAAKITIGGVLMIVGVAKLTGADKQVAVLGKAAAVAPLL